MGITAENLADEYNVTREEMDKFALDSQLKAVQAIKDGKFKNEIVPVELKDNKGNVTVFDTDEYPKANTTIEGLAKLKPAFKKDGRVTAGNASGINDGAAALLLVSEDYLKKSGLTAIAEAVDFAEAGVRPEVMGIGAAFAVKKLVKKADMDMAKVGLFELNEAFAAQSIATLRELKLEGNANVNVNGGAIAIGHPIGASGARIAVTLLHEMAKRKTEYGIASLCIGGGQGAAGLFKLVK
jgi:acetyl-CoA C-acetyltransferase